MSSPINPNLEYNSVRLLVSFTLNNGKSIDTVATGICVSKKYGDKEIPFLFTNKHVFLYKDNSEVKDVYVQVELREIKDPSVTKTFFISNWSFEGRDEFPVFFHDTEDVAMIPLINVFQNANDAFAVRCLPEHFLATKEMFENGFTIGSDISFIGFPKNLYNENGNLPTTRRGYIASNPSVFYCNSVYNIKGNIVLINGHSLSGASGSPVYAHNPMNTPYGLKYNNILIGIMSGHFNDLDTAQHLGVSFFIKSHILLEMINPKD